ncbi:hypothetical protein SCHPADRAFT_928637 [Schizopora paradoxa]|uniref:Dopa 4,5-dioxygenase n=1 Tax=Schizopora paradoxa TaxID=27342 RepID=A0A0H2RMR2_9AGAM|nr:hypothetical protein SCHPADRAFT_928637 [Schizopora paradoxa]
MTSNDVQQIATWTKGETQNATPTRRPTRRAFMQRNTATSKFGMLLQYTSPLSGYENAAPLPEVFNDDGKTFHNPPAPLSSAYDKFPGPMKQESGIHFHIYFMQGVPAQVKFAKELHERIRREFPELKTYAIYDRPDGPHCGATFEVNTCTPHETGALFSWLILNRGPCSVLIHPNTGDIYKDHAELVTWMGTPWPLYTDMFK